MEYLVLAGADPTAVSCPCSSCRFFELWPDDACQDAFGLLSNVLFPLAMSSGWAITLLGKRFPSNL